MKSIFLHDKLADWKPVELFHNRSNMIDFIAKSHLQWSAHFVINLS